MSKNYKKNNYDDYDSDHHDEYDIVNDNEINYENQYSFDIESCSILNQIFLEYSNKLGLPFFENLKLENIYNELLF